MDHFFNRHEKLMDDHKFGPNKSYIFKVDEASISVIPSQMPQVLNQKVKWKIGALTSVEKGSLITCVMYMSA